MEASEPRRLLLVSQRPIDYGGGGSVRWEFLRRVLPGHGWEVHTITARPNPTANEASTSAGSARLAAARARVMGAAGTVLGPVTRRVAGVQPEALAPNGLWALSGRGAIRRALDEVRPDVVWATCPPVSALFAAAAVLRNRREPLVGEFRDLWAGNPYFDAGGGVLTALEARAVARCGAVVSVTDGCVARLAEIHPELPPRLKLLPNGFDPELLTRRTAAAPIHDGGRSTLVHAGSLYGDRTAVALLRALSSPELATRIRLELVGTVDPASAAAIAAATASGLEVAVCAPVSWDEAVSRVLLAAVAVVINSPGTGGDMALPTKLYEALALGRPVLALTPPGSESERLLTALGQGVGCAAPDDSFAIAAAAGRLLANPPTPVAAERLRPWNRAVVAADVAALLDGLAAGRGSVA